MNCHSFNNALDLYAEGRLTPRRAREFDAHRAECARCRALAEPAPAASAPAVRAPEELKARLRAAARSAAPAASAGRALPLWPREARGIALAAAALLAVWAWIAVVGAPSQSSVAAAEEP